MYSRPLKIGYFILEGLNSFATTFYFYYFYFFMQQAFGYGNKANLVLAALNGGFYALFSWRAGKFAERYGYFTSMKLGFLLMLGALLVGSQLQSAPSQILVMLVAIFGLSFTWPSLEALVSGGESRAGVQQMVGLYNVVWAGTGAVGYFLGGAMMQTLGLRSLFFVPVAIQAIQLALTFWLEHRSRKSATLTLTPEVPLPPEPHPHSPAHAQRFLRMSLLANPFGYIAINTLVAVMPGVASNLGLSTAAAGFCCSVWCFARFGSFFLLWFWAGWHYRFRWLFFSFVALVGSFAVFLMVPNLVVLILSQLILGGALGLIYYSSLYYSMDLSDTKGEHGGIHEAAIGLGNCAGPAVGAVSIHFLPHYANSGPFAVTLLLLGGLAGLAYIWRGGKPARSQTGKPVAPPPPKAVAPPP